MAADDTLLSRLSEALLRGTKAGWQPDVPLGMSEERLQNMSPLLRALNRPFWAGADALARLPAVVTRGVGQVAGQVMDEAGLAGAAGPERTGRDIASMLEAPFGPMGATRIRQAPEVLPAQALERVDAPVPRRPIGPITDAELVNPAPLPAPTAQALTREELSRKLSAGGPPLDDRTNAIVNALKQRTALTPEAQRGQAAGFTTDMYHGTDTTFPMFRVDPHNWVVDQALGVHGSADPAAASRFAAGIYKHYDPEGIDMTKKPKGVVPGGNVIPLKAKGKFYDLPQPDDYPYAADPWERKRTDTRAFVEEITKRAFRADPSQLERALYSQYGDEWYSKDFMQKFGPDFAKQAAERLAKGESVNLTPHQSGEPYLRTLDDLIENVGLTATNKKDRVEMIKTAVKTLQDEGYTGIRYVNTAPGEVKGAKDPTAYVVFDPHSNLRSRFAKFAPGTTNGPVNDMNASVNKDGSALQMGDNLGTSGAQQEGADISRRTFLKGATAAGAAAATPRLPKLPKLPAATTTIKPMPVPADKTELFDTLHTYLKDNPKLLGKAPQEVIDSINRYISSPFEPRYGNKALTEEQLNKLLDTAGYSPEDAEYVKRNVLTLRTRVVGKPTEVFDIRRIAPGGSTREVNADDIKNYAEFIKTPEGRLAVDQLHEKSNFLQRLSWELEHAETDKDMKFADLINTGNPRRAAQALHDLLKKGAFPDHPDYDSIDHVRNMNVDQLTDVVREMQAMHQEEIRFNHEMHDLHAQAAKARGELVDKIADQLRIPPNRLHEAFTSQLSPEDQIEIAKHPERAISWLEKLASENDGYWRKALKPQPLKPGAPRLLRPDEVPPEAPQRQLQMGDNTADVTGLPQQEAMTRDQLTKSLAAGERGQQNLFAAMRERANALTQDEKQPPVPQVQNRAGVKQLPVGANQNRDIEKVSDSEFLKRLKQDEFRRPKAGDVEPGSRSKKKDEDKKE